MCDEGKDRWVGALRIFFTWKGGSRPNKFEKHWFSCIALAVNTLWKGCLNQHLQMGEHECNKSKKSNKSSSKKIKTKENYSKHEIKKSKKPKKYFGPTYPRVANFSLKVQGH